MGTIRLFTRLAHTEGSHRGSFAEILKAYVKANPISNEDRRAIYGIQPGEYEVVAEPTAADLAILPMTWNHYLSTRQLSKAGDFVREARAAGLPIASYVSGDEGVSVPPEFEDVWVIRASGSRSTLRRRQIAQPVFFEDPMKQLGMREEELFARHAGGLRERRLPTVGFCGQASVKLPKVALDMIRTWIWNRAYGLGLRLQEPQPVISPALLRAKALQVLSRTKEIRCNFILREKYRAGATTAEDRHRTTMEFYENMIGSDYVLCVRGAGNFSKRFYEALSVGAVPLLVDTDCVLPLDRLIRWDEVIVRVPADGLDGLGTSVVAHFKRDDDPGRQALRRRCRSLWLDRLTFGGFHRSAIETMLAGSRI